MSKHVLYMERVRDEMASGHYEKTQSRNKSTPTVRCVRWFNLILYTFNNKSIPLDGIKVEKAIYNHEKLCLSVY